MSGDVAVVILAGGEGSRIGGHKPLRTLAGERLIDRALRHARSWSNLVAISVRDPAQVELVGETLLMDAPAIEGPLGGLIAALEFARSNGRDFVLTIAADMPFLPADLLDRLLAGVQHRECALASSGGQMHPVCGLWRVAALQKTERYIATGKRSLRGLAERIGFETVDWPADPVDPFFNVNSPADLSRAEQML